MKETITVSKLSAFLQDAWQMQRREENFENKWCDFSSSKTLSIRFLLWILNTPIGSGYTIYCVAKDARESF